MTRPSLVAGRNLTGPELAEVATDLAAQRSLWERHVRHDPAERVYHKVLATPFVCAWLICWMPGHDTGFHDHDGSGGAVSVIAGQVREERLRIGAAAASTIAGPGDLLEFGPHDIHRVVHHGTEPAITLHAYSPTLRRMGQYEVDDRGVLLRIALDEDTELKAAA